MIDPAGVAAVIAVIATLSLLLAICVVVCWWIFNHTMRFIVD